MLRWAVWLTAAVFLAAAGFLMTPSPQAPAPTIKETEAPRLALEPRLEPVRRNLRDVTPSSVHRPPAPETGMIQRLPALVPAPEPLATSKLTRWDRPSVLHAGILDVQGMTIVIRDIRFLRDDKICFDALDQAWPCGRFAVLALRRLIRRRPIACDPAQVKPESRREIVTTCRISGFDIGAWLVGQGWARSLDSAYSQLETEARAKGLGQWARQRPVVP